MYPQKAVVCELNKERKKFYDRQLYVLPHEQSHKV